MKSVMAISGQCDQGHVLSALYGPATLGTRPGHVSLDNGDGPAAATGESPQDEAEDAGMDDLFTRRTLG